MSWTVVVFLAAALALGGYLIHRRLKAQVDAFAAQQQAAAPEVTGAAGMAPKVNATETKVATSGAYKGKTLFVRPVLADMVRRQRNILATNPNATL